MTLTPMKDVRGITGLLCYSLHSRQHPSIPLAHPQGVPVSLQPPGLGYIQHYEALGYLQVSPQTEGLLPGSMGRFMGCREQHDSLWDVKRMHQKQERWELGLFEEEQA